ncbi:MAG: penicillin acylase family protein [Bacteroidota bacterium]
MKKAILIILVVILSLSVFGYWYLTSTKPIYEGELKVQGLQNPVTVKYDQYGIPHIYASNEPDAYFALGYLQAQERLFQMEMVSRVATGTLSEILGPDFVEVDKLFRTLGIAKKSEEFTAAFNKHDNDYKEAATSYFRGINAFVQDGPTPIEFTVIGIPKREFSITDAYNAAGYMSFGFADGLRVDPLASKISVKLDSAYLDDIGLHSIYDSTFIKSYIKAESAELTRLAQIINKIPIPLLKGSNSWIVGPEKSASGNALFENDTHIAYSQPSVWFEAHMEYPEFSLYGHYLAGFPFAVLGHNRFATWGLTMFENDDVDLYQEKANPDNQDQIWRVDKWLGLESRKETINIKGEDPLEIDIRSSDHGPIINDVLLKDSIFTHPVSVWWEYLNADKDLFEPIFSLGKCASISEARKAASLIQAPGLNLMYADADNNIAWWACARLPIRPDHVNSKLLLDGSSGRDDILGYYDFKSNPQAENPPWNYVYSANNQPDTINGVLYPGYYRPIDRASRIEDELRKRNNWTAEEFRELSGDVISPISPLVAKELATVLSQSDDEEVKKLANILANWDGDHQLSMIEPTIYYNLLSWTLYHAMADELGYEDFKILANSEIMLRSYLHFISNDSSIWWDDVSTETEETRQMIVLKGVESALETLLKIYNSDNPDDWHWEKVHTLTHRHPLGEVDLLKKYFNVGPYPTIGGKEVLNDLSFHLDTIGYFPIKDGPSQRTIIDLGNMDDAMSINPTGQSGHFLSKHYDDQAQMYIDVEFRPQLMNESEIEENKISVLTLIPETK